MRGGGRRSSSVQWGMEGCRRGKLGARGTERASAALGADGCVAEGAREQMQWKLR